MKTKKNNKRFKLLTFLKNNELCSIISYFPAPTQHFFIFRNFYLVDASLLIFHRHALAVEGPILVILLFLLCGFLFFQISLYAFLHFLKHLFALLDNSLNIIDIKREFDFLLLDFHASPLGQNRGHENQAGVD